MNIESKRAIFLNTASQVIVRILTLALSLAFIKLLTNYLGVTGVGEYNAINTYMGMIIVVADLGLYSVTVREITKNPKDETKILSNVLTIRAVSAVLAALLSIIIVYFTHYENAIKLGVLIASGYIIFNLIASVYDMALQAKLKMQYSATAELISKLTSVAALALVIYYNGHFFWVVSTISLYGLATLITKYYFTQRFARFGPAYDRQVSRWIINLAWPLGLVFIVNNIFFKLDTLMLFAIKGTDAVGIYSVAYRILEVNLFVGAYFANSLLPAISRNITSNKERVGRIVAKGLMIMLFIALPVTLLCAIVPKEIITLLSNSDFALGASSLVILAFALPLIYCDTLLGLVLIAHDERKFMIRMAISIMLVNFIANLFMIAQYSYVGAAITTTASELILLVVNYLYLKKIVTFHLNYARVGKILLVALLSFAIGYMLKIWHINYLVVGAGTLVAYALLSWAFDIINLPLLRSLVQKEDEL
jgi:O-antigen/teichoic acid export membrane protein